MEGVTLSLSPIEREYHMAMRQVLRSESLLLGAVERRRDVEIGNLRDKGEEERKGKEKRGEVGRVR